MKNRQKITVSSYKNTNACRFYCSDLNKRSVNSISNSNHDCRCRCRCWCHLIAQPHIKMAPEILQSNAHLFEFFSWHIKKQFEYVAIYFFLSLILQANIQYTRKNSTCSCKHFRYVFVHSSNYWLMHLCSLCLVLWTSNTWSFFSAHLKSTESQPLNTKCGFSIFNAFALLVDLHTIRSNKSDQKTKWSNKKNPVRIFYLVG